jgi:hypothetical protein
MISGSLTFLVGGLVNFIGGGGLRVDDLSFVATRAWYLVVSDVY